MAEIPHFIGKTTPKTLHLKADHSKMDLFTKTGVLRLEFGNKPPLSGAMKPPVEVDLDVIVDIAPELSRPFLVYMVKLAKAVGMDLEAVAAGASSAPAVAAAAPAIPTKPGHGTSLLNQPDSPPDKNKLN